MYTQLKKKKRWFKHHSWILLQSQNMIFSFFLVKIKLYRGIKGSVNACLSSCALWLAGDQDGMSTASDPKSVGRKQSKGGESLSMKCKASQLHLSDSIIVFVQYF